MTAWLKEFEAGVEIALYVAPRASRTRVIGEHDGRLKVQIAAPPVDGAANKEITKLLAATLGVSRGSVTIVAGDASKRKTVRVEGVILRQAVEAFDA